MSSLLPCPIDKRKSIKLTVLMMLLFCTLPIIINTVGIVPLYTTVSSNVAFEASALLTMLKYVQEFLDLTAYSVSFALIIFLALVISKKRALLASLLFAISVILRIPLRFVMNIVLFGTLGTLSEITIEAASLALVFAIEMIQLLIVYIFATTDANRYLYHIELNRPNKSKKRKTFEKKSVLPFEKIINWYNPLQRTAIKTSILITVIKVAMRIFNDIDYGAPKSFGEVAEMILGYSTDVLFGIVAYVISLLVFNFLFDRIKVKKTDEDTSSSVL